MIHNTIMIYNTINQNNNITECQKEKKKLVLMLTQEESEI